MHKYYHNNVSANKQNRDAQTRERGGSAELNLVPIQVSWLKRPDTLQMVWAEKLFMQDSPHRWL
jgi:hypothetical protein